MEELLKQLTTRGIKLYIATNKRSNPTSLILNYLSFQTYFNRIYCSDTNGKTYASKIEMVKDILEKEKLKPRNTILIGDTYQDQIAAKQNEITFIYAAYGFGNLESVEKTIDRPLEAL